MRARQIGRYAVFGELAAGGMATVHFGRLAGAAGFSRRVAVKSLHAQFAKDPDFLAMFLDEARLSARVQHPNVVQVLDVISTVTELHLVMEYIEGESLAKLIRVSKGRGQRVPVPIVIAIMVGVLEGLHAAHEARSEDGRPLHIVHRDVSPQNVLVGVDGVPRILDFGIAKAVGRMQTTRGDQLKGKLAYMAPEHLAREPLDRRADVYAAGIMLWELCTGARLFQAEDEISTFRRALEAKVPAPRSVVPELPVELDAVVLRALAKRPADRYQTARELACALEDTKRAASTRELSEWVRTSAHATLAQRAALIDEYEAAASAPSHASPVAELGAAAPIPMVLVERMRSEQADTAVLAQPAAAVAATSPEPTRNHKRRWLLIGALGLVVPMVAAWAWLGRAAPVPEPAAAIQKPAATSPQLPAPTPREAAAVLVEATSQPVSEPPTATSRNVGAVARSRPAASGAAATKRAKPAGCATPFTVDARGVKVPKLECL